MGEGGEGCGGGSSGSGSRGGVTVERATRYRSQASAKSSRLYPFLVVVSSRRIVFDAIPYVLSRFESPSALSGCPLAISDQGASSRLISAAKRSSVVIRSTSANTVRMSFRRRTPRLGLLALLSATRATAAERARAGHAPPAASAIARGASQTSASRSATPIGISGQGLPRTGMMDRVHAVSRFLR